MVSWLDRHDRSRRSFDWAVAVGAAALSLSLLAASIAPVGPAAYGVALVHTLALGWRRRKPEAVLAVASATGIAFAVAGHDPALLGLAILVAVYTVGFQCSLVRSLSWLVFVELNVLVGLGLAGVSYGLPTKVINVFVLAGAWLLGTTSGRWQKAAAEHERRALELEAVQNELAHKAVTDERLRLARELHDVVAHGMSVIAIHAGTGRLLMETDPAAAGRSLTVIEKASRDALADMRRLVGVLRDSSGSSVELAPAPRIHDVERLAKSFADAGLPVALRIEGIAESLPRSIEVSVYRIVQEALTNVLKHAPGATARVVISRLPHEVTVTVTNDGVQHHVPAIPGAGLGVTGMRERTSVFAGTLTAGRVAGGGYRVHARFPLGNEEP